nr:hypothetical protein [Tanacetum cinerariifolium]
LKDTVTSFNIQNDGYKVTNVNLNRCYEELSKANTHLRTTSLEKIAAQKAEIATLIAKTVDNKSSGTTKPANPKVIALGIYAISPKYIVPQRRTNRETPIHLPKKKQVTFQETHKPSPRFIKKPVAPLLKKPNVNVPLFTGIKSATRASKPPYKSNAWIYRKLPAKSAKGEKVEEHIRNLNKNNRVDSHVKRHTVADSYVETSKDPEYITMNLTMDITIDQQVALDEALVPHASRLRIRKSNFCLRSDITSKESTLQLVYDVLRLTPFYKVFLVTANVPEIYMQEFWATATVHHHSICFKMDNMKRIVNQEYFREMLHICPRLPGQTFDELPFEEEILAFLRFLGHSEEIMKLTDILWGMYHKKNVDFTYLLWEDFIYKVEHKDAKKSNEMYYPMFTKVVIHYFMTKDPLIPRRNKFGVMLPVELTNEDIRNSEAYKEYYAVASGAAPPKTKASIRKTKSSFDTTITPPTAAGTRLLTSAKGKQNTKSSKAKGLTMLFEVAITEARQMKLAMKRSLQQTHISQASSFGADKGTGNIPGVPNVPTDESDEEIS